MFKGSLLPPMLKGLQHWGWGMIESPHFGEAVSALANAANLAVYTTDPRLLIALTTVIVAVITVVIAPRVMRYAARDEALFSDFSREHQREREARFLAQFTGRHEHMANAPHVAGSPGSLYFAGMGAAHDDRSPCAECGSFPVLSGGVYCLHCDDLLPADRFSAGAR